MARHPLSPTFDAPPDPRAGPVALAVLTAVAVFLVGGVLPSAAFFDTGEFGAVAWRLSISHPPGHPVHAAVTGAILRLPLGDVPFRANLASALCLAAALGAFALLLRALAPRLSVIGIIAAAALPAVMPAIWLQGVRAEVYALQLLLSVGLAGLCLAVARGRDARALPALALTFGLAGANHSLLGLALVPVALLAIALGRPGRRALLAAVPAGALGLSAYLWLPLRATAGDEVGWGRPDTLADFWAVLSAKDWQGNLVRTEALDLADNAYQVTDYLMSQIGYAPAGLFFVVLAAGGAGRRAADARPHPRLPGRGRLRDRDAVLLPLRRPQPGHGRLLRAGPAGPRRRGRRGGRRLHPAGGRAGDVHPAGGAAVQRGGRTIRGSAGARGSPSRWCAACWTRCRPAGRW